MGCFSSTGEKRPLHRSIAGEKYQMLRVFGSRLMGPADGLDVGFGGKGG